MNKEIFCTLGPASMNGRVITRLEKLGVSLFRINLSHTRLEDLGAVIDYVQSRTSVPLCLDTEGAQIRTGALAEGQVVVRDNALVRVFRAPVPGDSQRFNFYPAGVVDLLEPGDFVTIDFQAVLAQVVEVEPGSVVLRILNGGAFGANRAVTVARAISLPPLTEKDRAALEIGRQKGVRTLALSFANRGADIDEIREVSHPDALVIAKIECRAGLVNLDEIAAKSDALLIDRDDLSRELPIERIPALQKWVTARAKAVGRKVYVATNLVGSMASAPVPTRAEVNDVFNSLLDGVDGLVLAAETAIGGNPIATAEMIVRLVKDFEDGAGLAPDRLRDYGAIAARSLVAPVGGPLVRREAAMPPADELSDLKRLAVGEKVLLDCEQIGAGTYTPVDGFMDRETLDRVLAEHRLPDGAPWTMPILLQVDEATAAGIGTGERVLLTSEAGDIHALLDVAGLYRMELDSLAERWYGTRSGDHPGVAAVTSGGRCFIAGRVTPLVGAPSPYRRYVLTPAQARCVFAHKGWSRVVGFHGRNVIHRAHEHLLLSALDTSGADGLLISPVVGPKKSGDFLPEPILKSYQMMLDLGLLPADRAVLGGLATYPRYGGPREAVFTAICRRNMGCSHFIVGRDHAGVGDFYSTGGTRALFDELGDVGITPLFFEAVGYNPRRQRYETVDEANGVKMISGTELRLALKEDRRLPDWFVREIIQDTLRADMAAGRPVFCD